MLKRAIVGVLIAATLAPSGMAWAAGGEGGDVRLRRNLDGGELVLRAEDELLRGGQSDLSGSRGSSGERVCTYLGQVIDCVTQYGVWSESRACWLERLDPQPPVDDPVWQRAGRPDADPSGGNSPDSPAEAPPGVVLSCFGPGGAQDYRFWVPSGEEPEVSPEVLAWRAVEQMGLVAPRIGMTPLREGAPMVVGVDSWMWVADPDARSFGPVEARVSAGSVTVEARGHVENVVWDTGDGSRWECEGPGTPWREGMPATASPTCGHRFERTSAREPGGVFRVRASAQWVVDWSGAGASGRLRFELTSTRDLEVVEVHVLNVA